MSRQSWAWFFLLVFTVIGLDQGTKAWATNHLANPRFGHYVALTAQSDQSVARLVDTELVANTAAERRTIARRSVINKNNRVLEPNSRVRAGETVYVTQREIVVIPRYFDLAYARNPGAAFGALANEDASWRVPFFLVITLISLVFFLAMARAMRSDQWLLLGALGLLMGGTIGNLIDRVAYGWVIDFIAWQYKSYRWPTFNVADSAIVVGTILIFVGVATETARMRRSANAIAQRRDQEE